MSIKAGDRMPQFGKHSGRDDAHKSCSDNGELHTNLPLLLYCDLLALQQ